jgi:hypothetical protein
MPAEKLYLDPVEAAEHLKAIGAPISAASLATMRSIGTGPKFMRFGRHPKYRADWLLEFVEARLSARGERVRSLTDPLDAPREDAPAPKAAAAPVQRDRKAAAPSSTAPRRRGRPRIHAAHDAAPAALVAKNGTP